MVDITTQDSLEGILPDQGMLADDHPETIIANLPSTLIVSALENQLTKALVGYTSVDYLSPIISATNVLSDRYKDDPEIVGSIAVSLDSILSRVVDTITKEWNIDFSQIGLDAGSPNYVQDVLELYRFFVVDRINLGMELIFHIIVSNRKRFVEQYRKSIEKKNQTVSEARRVFQQFEDVAIWVAMPQIFEDLKNTSAWEHSFHECLGMLMIDYSSKFLLNLAVQWPNDEFSNKYFLPVLSEETESYTMTCVQNWWLGTAAKKDPGEVLDSNTNDQNEGDE